MKSEQESGKRSRLWLRLIATAAGAMLLLVAACQKDEEQNNFPLLLLLGIAASQPQSTGYFIAIPPGLVTR